MDKRVNERRPSTEINSTHIKDASSSQNPAPFNPIQKFLAIGGGAAILVGAASDNRRAVAFGTLAVTLATFQD